MKKISHLFFVWVGITSAWAGDFGPRDSTPPTTQTPSRQNGPGPTAAASIPGPLPSDQKSPVTPATVPAGFNPGKEVQSSAQVASTPVDEIQEIKSRLKNDELTMEERARLKKRIRALQKQQKLTHK